MLNDGSPATTTPSKGGEHPKYTDFQVQNMFKSFDAKLKVSNPILDPKKAQKEFEQMLDKYLVSNRKEAVLNMLYSQKLCNRFLYEIFFDAPASNYLSRHCAFPGGLICHTVTVLHILFRMRKIVEIRTSNLDESIFIAGAFHDLGKIGDEYGNYYVPETNEWWVENRGRTYDYNPHVQHMPHAVRSLYLLQKYEIPLTIDEYFAIHYHDGLFLGQGTDVKHNQTSLSLALHFADSWSCYQLEKTKDPNNWHSDKVPF